MSRNARYVLAGLQAGIGGAIGLLLWMSLASRFFGKSVWWALNVVGTIFYGDFALRNSAGRYTFSGVALIFLLYGSIGILFGLVWRDRRGGGALMVATLLTAVVAYYVLVKWAWRNVSPLGAVYAPERQIFIGHLLFATILTRYPRFRDRLLPAIPSGDH